MERLLAMLLSILLVGCPTAAGLTAASLQAETRRAAQEAALLEAKAEEETLRVRLDDAMAEAQRRAEDEARRIAEEESARREEEARQQEEAARQAAMARGPASVDLSWWQSRYSDVVGYIYNPGTAISYPIVYGNTDFYLHHNLDGQEDVNGSIILAEENSADFSDGNSILYGHNMKAGNMFASLQYYKSQDFYTSHPCMYLYAPGQTYRVDLFAGFPCPHDADVYYTSLTAEKLDRYIAQSTFSAGRGAPSGNVLTLSTCSYEHDNWRYVVLGELVPID